MQLPAERPPLLSQRSINDLGVPISAVTGALFEVCHGASLQVAFVCASTDGQSNPHAKRTRALSSSGTCATCKAYIAERRSCTANTVVTMSGVSRKQPCEGARS